MSTGTDARLRSAAGETEQFHPLRELPPLPARVAFAAQGVSPPGTSPPVAHRPDRQHRGQA